MKYTTIVRLGLVAAGLLASACVTTVKGGSPPQERIESDWVLPSSSLRDDIEQQAAALPYRHGTERIEAITWFTTIGEPAYETLLAFLADDRQAVVGSALAALGATRDHRLVPYLREAGRPEWTGTTLALEYARTRVRLGDWDAMPVLIDGMESEVKLERALCVETLFEATRERHGYSAGASLPERQAAIQRWRGWWERRSADELLAGS